VIDLPRGSKITPVSRMHGGGGSQTINLTVNAPHSFAGGSQELGPAPRRRARTLRGRRREDPHEPGDQLSAFAAASTARREITSTGIAAA